MNRSVDSKSREKPTEAWAHCGYWLVWRRVTKHRSSLRCPYTGILLAGLAFCHGMRSCPTSTGAENLNTVNKEVLCQERPVTDGASTLWWQNMLWVMWGSVWDGACASTRKKKEWLCPHGCCGDSVQHPLSVLTEWACGNRIALLLWFTVEIFYQPHTLWCWGF